MVGLIDDFALALIEAAEKLGCQDLASSLREIYATGSETQKKRMADATAIAFNMSSPLEDPGIGLFMATINNEISKGNKKDQWLEGALKTAIAINMKHDFPDPRPAFIEKILWALTPDEKAREMFASTSSN